jgi:hypothetical protein
VFSKIFEEKFQHNLETSLSAIFFKYPLRKGGLIGKANIFALLFYFSLTPVYIGAVISFCVFLANEY